MSKIFETNFRFLMKECSTGKAEFILLLELKKFPF